jgi:hypothetical protein
LVISKRFHIALHGRPAGATSGKAVSIEGCDVRPLVSPEPLSQTPLPVTFEEAEVALRRLPRLFFEPDGSFGWFSAPGEPRWDIGGMLYDRGDRIMYAELTGACPAAEFSQILEALGAAREPLAVQLVEQAIFLAAEDFCRLLLS